MRSTGFYVVVFHDPQTIPYLRGGFALRCFQRLSRPNIATRRSTWWQSRQTRGSFIPVLSSHNHISLCVQTISLPVQSSPVGEWQVWVSAYYRCSKTSISRAHKLMCFGQSLRGQPFDKLRVTSHGINSSSFIQKFWTAKLLQTKAFTVISRIVISHYCEK